MMILYWFAWFNTGRTKSSNGMEGTRFSHPSYFFPRILNFLILKHLSTNHFIWSINLAISYLISILFTIRYLNWTSVVAVVVWTGLNWLSGCKSTSQNNLLVQESCSKPYHRPAIILQYYPELFFENMMKTRNLWLIIFGIGDCIWLNCYCWGKSSMVVGRFSKWF